MCSFNFFPHWVKHFNLNLISADDDPAVRDKVSCLLTRLLREKEYEDRVRLVCPVRSMIKSRVRTYLLPKINFKAPTYYELCTMKVKKIKGPDNPPDGVIFLDQHGDWKKVTMPPLLEHFTQADIDKIRDVKLDFEYPCHSQSCEHGVQATSCAVGRRRTDKTQLGSVLQRTDAQKEFEGIVTHKRFRE